MALFSLSSAYSIENKDYSFAQQKSSSEFDDNDLWQYIAKKLTLKSRSQRDLYWHIDWFKKNPDYLTRVTKRATPYLHLVVQEVEKAGLPIELALLPIVESAYYPFSYSQSSASGLWQFVPSTGKLYGLKQNYWVDERRSVVKSTRAAISYLRNLHKLFKGDWLLAIASYNSGPGRVQRAIKKNKSLGKKADFWNISLPEETKGYVPRLLAVAELIRNPERYGQIITPILNKAQLESVYVHSQLDLSLISQWTGLNLAQIYTLNPDLNRWATPDERYELLLPIGKVESFKRANANYPKSKQLNYKVYIVKPGDSLNKLAKKFNSSVSYIKSVNNIQNSTIKYGEKIIIPIPKQPKIYYSLPEAQNTEARLKGFAKIGINVKRILNYRVKIGDTLSVIAQKFGVQVSELRRWNKLARNKPLQIGLKLKIIKPIVK